MNNVTSLDIQKVEPKSKAYRFDIFKGIPDATGKIHREKSVGGAYLLEGCKTYTIYLKTFLNDVFYLLPEKTKEQGQNFVILTREASRNPGRKYFWNSVGIAVVLNGENAGLAKLSFDLLGCDNIYLNLYPKNPNGD